MKSVALGLLLVVVVMMALQHLRYSRARRGPAQDRQRSLYAGSAFHVLTFLRAPAEGDVLEALRKLRNELESGGQAEMVYAGRVALMALSSSQLPEIAWDAVVLVQYPSREAFDRVAGSGSYRATLGGFAETFSQGLDRPVALNLAIPQLLMGLRAYELLTGKGSHYPLVPASEGENDGDVAARRIRLGRLDALRELSEDAVVVVNLLKAGTAEQRKSDRAYGLQMAGLFAEGGHGPLHMGRAVTIEGDAEFDRVALVYYPGIDYMKKLMGSRFFRSIVSGKQPGDTLAAPTVPVLSRL